MHKCLSLSQLVLKSKHCELIITNFMNKINRELLESISRIENIIMLLWKNKSFDHK